MLIDGFEDGNLDEWAGSTDYVASTANPFDGAYSLAITTTSAGTRTLTRTDVSWGPTDDSTLQCWISREHTAALLFGVQSSTEYYYAQLVDNGTTDSDVRIAIADNGFSSLASSTLGIDRTAYEWLRLVVVWETDGTITVTVYDETATELGRVTTTDTTYGAGGVGIDIYTGDTTERATHVDTIETISTEQGDVATHTDVDGEFDIRTALDGASNIRTSLRGNI